MAITLEAIRAAGGIVHSDGNIFFRDISMLQGLAGAAPAAVAPQGVVAWMTPEGDRVVTAETMDGARKDGGASLSSLRPYTVALVRAGEPAAAAPALEAPAAPAVPPLTPDEARWAARSADRMRGPSDVTSGTEYAMAGAMALAKKLAAAPQAPAAPVEFQQRVQPWMMACFGAEIAADRAERNHRFLEESLELVQSCGCTASEAHQLVDYVFGRPVGEPAQEAGGVMVTLAALCLANSLDMHEAGETELARIWTKVEAIRAKQAAKPKHSPLPAAPAAVAPQGERQWICPTRTVADLVNNLLTMDQGLPVYGAQYIEKDGRRCAIAVPPTVSRERVLDGRWIGQGEELNAAVVWTRAEQPAAVAWPALDVTLDEDQAGLLRDMLGDPAEYPEAITVRLLVGDGHSGHGLYVAQAEYQDEGAVLLSSLPAPAAPALEAPAAPTLVGDEQADSYLAEPGRLATLARSHPAGLVRALARAALAAAPQAPSGVLGWVHPQWAAEQGRGRIYGHNPGGYIAVQIAAPQAPAAPDELAARLRKAAATLAVRHSSYSNISIAWPDEKLLKSAEGRYHQALVDLDALISAIPTETKQTADRDQLDSLARKKLGALLNAFGEAQWQAGRGVPCPSIEDAFEAVISAAVGLLAAQPVATDAYLKLADAMGYDSGKDGIEWSPEEWAAHLLAAYRVAPAAPFGYAAYWPNQVEKATLFPPKLGDSTWAAFRNAGQIVTPLYERPAPAAPAVDAETVKKAARYDHLRDCNSGSLVVVQITGTGEDDWHVLTEGDADEAIDTALAAQAKEAVRDAE